MENEPLSARLRALQHGAENAGRERTVSNGWFWGSLTVTYKRPKLEYLLTLNTQKLTPNVKT